MTLPETNHFFLETSFFFTLQSIKPFHFGQLFRVPLCLLDGMLPGMNHWIKSQSNLQTCQFHFIIHTSISNMELSFFFFLLFFQFLYQSATDSVSYKSSVNIFDLCSSHCKNPRIHWVSQPQLGSPGILRLNNPFLWKPTVKDFKFWNTLMNNLNILGQPILVKNPLQRILNFWIQWWIIYLP